MGSAALMRLKALSALHWSWTGAWNHMTTRGQARAIPADRICPKLARGRSVLFRQRRARAERAAVLHHPSSGSSTSTIERHLADRLGQVWRRLDGPSAHQALLQPAARFLHRSLSGGEGYSVRTKVRPARNYGWTRVLGAELPDGQGNSRFLGGRSITFPSGLMDRTTQLVRSLVR